MLILSKILMLYTERGLSIHVSEHTFVSLINCEKYFKDKYLPLFYVSETKMLKVTLEV